MGALDLVTLGMAASALALSIYAARLTRRSQRAVRIRGWDLTGIGPASEVTLRMTSAAVESAISGTARDPRPDSHHA